MLFHHAGDKDHLSLQVEARKATLQLVKGGRALTLATASLPATSGPIEFVIRRRFWQISLLCNGQIVARAYDSNASGGRVGWNASQGVQVDLRLQATEPVSYADDFARAAADASEWEVLAGECRVAEVAVGNHAGDIGRFSSNAFSYQMKAQPLALATAGYWFMDDYAVDASAKPEAHGAIGLAACVLDDKNYLLFRVSSAPANGLGTGAREIVRVRNGKETVLASQPGGFAPGQWYRLRFVACDGALLGYVDGRLACSARDESLVQGKVGLYARNCANVSFDDVRAVGAFAFTETFREDTPQKWTDSGLSWSTQTRSRQRQTARAGEGVTVTGRPDWDNYVFAADVAPGQARTVGLCFGYSGPGDYCLLRVPASPSGKAAVVRVANGKSTTLAESAQPLAVTKRARLRIDVRGGRVKGYVDDKLVVEAFDPLGQQGRVGFYANGPAGASFGNVGSWFRIEDDEKARVETQFTQEKTMSGWADERSSWRRDAATGALWHAGEFFGNARVQVTLGKEREAVTARLVLNGNGSRMESGYELVADITAAGKARLQLRRQGKTVAAKEGAWDPAGERRFRLWRDGEFIAGTLGDSVAVFFHDTQPLNGTKVGIQYPYTHLVFSSLEATTSNLLDCTFSGPPTEWWSGRGVWDVVQRWPCDDRWSFFGGMQSESPMLWTKQSFQGDIVAEAWLALYMDNIDDPRIGYKHPSDLNLSFCANGKDPSSGYSFLFAAANNTVTRIMRKDKVVAETDQVKMVNARRVNLAFQRHWFHLRAEKRGSLLRFYVDGRLAGEFNDPDPLPGGQVALWSWQNGLMVARARVWYERDGGMCALPQPSVRPAPVLPADWKLAKGGPVTLVSDFEEGVDGWSAPDSAEAPLLALGDGKNGKGLRVVNRVSGGEIAVNCGVQRFDAARLPSLRFDYRVDPEAKVNLYARIQRRWIRVDFTAPEFAEADVTRVGAIPGVVADGQWHTAQLDLRVALKKALGDGTSLVVEDLCFRSPNAEYLRSGFSGNRWGTEYHLDNFALVGDESTTADDAKAVVLRAAGK